METQSIQFIAGTISSLMFVTGNLPMLHKAFKTKNLKSYSLANIVMSNCGNLLYWLYVASLPIGSIWFLHGFFTLSTALMFIGYIRYELHGSAQPLAVRTKFSVVSRTE